ncbi:chagasin family peptidase inhibitor I42 [Sinobacterium caligoides]|uniref:Chagasin family peptidase inhibitor I42 n=1 Tax=Sinobacterium caligoides TaxID=933926 RepID=A0A3N2DYS2_9GAMM|nr:protease inhibitor I42 family protein [Sinobacterium caligoides]ROS04944.1 chagasin family peptidase inhibitor I42 [Sinobacterium caligoides]
MDNREGVVLPLAVEVGHPFVIELDENLSTGFTVCLMEMPECLALVADEPVQPDGDRRVGVFGRRRFTFVAVKAGGGALNFNRIKFTHPELTIVERSASEQRFVVAE